MIDFLSIIVIKLLIVSKLYGHPITLYKYPLTFGNIHAEIWTTYKDGRENTPPQTIYWQQHNSFNAKTLTYTDGRDVFTNPSNYGLILLPPLRPNYANRNTFFDGECNQKLPLTKAQKNALQLLKSHAKPLKNGGIVWLYDYDSSSNDTIIKAPYPSAFAQAVNVHALLFAYCKTKDPELLALAKKGGKGLITPIKDGGTEDTYKHFIWFSEMPAPPGFDPYIVNAHLYSIAVLYALNKATGDNEFKKAAEKGLRSFDNVNQFVDTGYWTRYDLRPRSTKLYFEAHIKPYSWINRIEINNPFSHEKFTICDKDCDAPLQFNDVTHSFNFAIYMPSLQFFSPNNTFITYKIDYKNKPPILYAPSNRPGNNELFKIDNGNSIDLSDMAWSQTNNDYELWHAFLMGQIYEWTKQPKYFVMSARWRNYLRMEEQDNTKIKLKNRIYNRKQNAIYDQVIFDCFKNANPLDIDFDKAYKLHQCASNLDYSKLLAYIGLN